LLFHNKIFEIDNSIFNILKVKMKNLGSTDKKGPKSDAAPIPASKITDSNAGEGPPVNQSSAENDFFNKHYNKELRVSKDEIPIVLAELNESAIAFIKKE
jgi:hypothetical protein